MDMGARSASEYVAQAALSVRDRQNCLSYTLAFLVLLTSVSRIQAQRGVEEPPVAGRPADFSGLVGFFRISTSASPTEVRVEDPLTLTVRITGDPDRSFRTSHPVRANLHLFSKQMKEDFFIEP